MFHRARQLAILALSLAAPALAQEHPANARGFAADKVFQVGDLDSVNMMNGNLTIAIPIGQSYPIREGFSYQLTLVYNSNVWDFESVQGPGPEDPTYTEALPYTHGNAGLGWTLSLGRLLDLADPLNKTPYWVYVAPDGSEHSFYDSLHDGESTNADYGYTRDNTYLRLRKSARTVEFPNGQIHTFAAGRYLTEMRDQFSNTLTVQIANNSWTISDSTGRGGMTVNFGFASAIGQQVSSVVLRGIGNKALTWTFDYDSHDVARDCRDTDPNNSVKVNVPLLKAINGPESLVYKMQRTNGSAAYRDTASCQANPPVDTGVIENLQVPTKGTIAWDWRRYPLGVFDTEPLHTQYAVGVKTRNLSSGTSTSGTWSYDSSSTGLSGQTGAELTTTVQLPATEQPPKRGSTKYYFFLPRPTNKVYPRPWEYGLPYSKTVSPWANLYLSSEVLDEYGVRKRSHWVAYTHDLEPVNPFDDARRDVWTNTNRRVVTERDKYDDDGVDRWLETARDPNTFDGLGHYRRVNVNGKFSNATADKPSRITNTHYNGDGCYRADGACGGTFTPPGTSASWLLETFDRVDTQEGGVTARQEFTFSPAGFLTCIRTLKSGTSESAFDTSEVRVQVGGNLKRQKFFGGDVGTAPSCTSTDTPTYWLEHNYSGGVRSLSFHKNPATGTTVGFFELDLTIDASTGLPTASRDSAGIQTNYSYDDLGRLTFVEPTGPGNTDIRMARTNYTYTFSTGASASYNKVNAYTSCPAYATCSSPNPLAQREYWYDGFGRLSIERVQRPAATQKWSRKATSYNAAGWVTSTTEWGDDPSTGGSTIYSNFDLFGRATKVTLPDGKIVGLTYYGVRQTDRTVRIATTTGGTEGDFITSEYKDALGRLVKIVDPATITEYGYDVGNRLASVDQGGGTQTRSFVYDNRGFLVSERHPEKSGLVKYFDYDARGHALRARDGAETTATREVGYAYDKAERLTEVRLGAGGEVLKRFTYDDTAAGGPYAEGKLTKAESTNDFRQMDPSQNYIFYVTENYFYGGRGGNLSWKSTNSVNGTVDYGTFTQTFTWDPVGAVGQQTYPAWTLATTPSRTLTNTFNLGLLTSVTGKVGSTTTNYASSIGYSDNLALASVVHGNGVTDTIGKDANGLPRPASISTSNVLGGQNWSSGSYAYDGAGNVKAMGSDKFTYDGVSRLTLGSLGSLGATGFDQSVTFDPYGNVTGMTTAGVGLTFGTSTATNRLDGGTYDDSGNLTMFGGGRYQYDRLNRMMYMANDLENWFFVYTADDERLGAYCAAGEQVGKFRWTVRDLNNSVIRETNSFVGTSPPLPIWVGDWVHRGDQLLAYEPASGPQQNFTLDHLGTPRLITSATKAKLALHTYFPFGQEATSATQDAQVRKFTGHERDFFSGAGTADDLEYLHARFRSPLTGRFLSPDTLPASMRDSQSWNRYSYVGGSPVSFLDPDGLGRMRAVLWLVERTPQGLRLLEKLASRKEAARLVHEGADVLAKNEKDLAFRIAEEAGGGRAPIWEAAHGEHGYRPHYHPYGREGGHVFYSVAGALTAAHYAEGHGRILEFLAGVADIVNPLSVGQDILDLYSFLSPDGSTLFEGVDVTATSIGSSPSFYTYSEVPSVLLQGLDSYNHHSGSFVSVYDLFQSGAVCIEGVCQ
jgi:RHS repeat-associated protein